MDYTKVQTLNYSTHAIEQFSENVKSFEGVYPLTAYAYGKVIQLLKESIKFIMPNCCDIIHPDDFKQTHLDLLKLPFPVIALEASWIKEGSEGSSLDFMNRGIGISTKRIALCFESSLIGTSLFPELNYLLNFAPDGGVFVIPIYWQNQIWQIGMGGCFVYYNNKFENINSQDNLPKASKMVTQGLLEENIASSKNKIFKAEPFVLLPEIVNKAVVHTGSHENVQAQIIADSRDEAMMVMQACAILNCANIETIEISAPKMLNKKRKSKGKIPFFSYHVLQVTSEKNQKNNLGGTHASPRMHLRRGHFRRLEDKTIWINAAMINAESKSGFVLKDYRIKP